MSNFSPAPVPMAETRSDSSALASTLSSASPSALRILPRRGSTACVWLLRPCLAEPPAESPSTMNSSDSSRSVDLQSASLPGRFSRRCVARLAFDLVGRLARCQPGLGRQHDAADDLVRGRLVAR